MIKILFKPNFFTYNLIVLKGDCYEETTFKKIIEKLPTINGAN